MIDVGRHPDDLEGLRRAKAMRQRKRQDDDDRERVEKEKRQKRSDKQQQDKEMQMQKEDEVKQSLDAIQRYQAAKITERYAYANAAEQVARAAAAMTAGSQDNRRARSVSESLEGMVHDTNATFSSMDSFVDDYMQDAREAAMEMEF